MWGLKNVGLNLRTADFLRQIAQSFGICTLFKNVFFKKIFFNSFYFLAALAKNILPCRELAFPGCGEQGATLVVVHGLIVVASLAVDLLRHLGFRGCALWPLECGLSGREAQA